MNKLNEELVRTYQAQNFLELTSSFSSTGQVSRTAELQFVTKTQPHWKPKAPFLCICQQQKHDASAHLLLSSYLTEVVSRVIYTTK